MWAYRLKIIKICFFWYKMCSRGNLGVHKNMNTDAQLETFPMQRYQIVSEIILLNSISTDTS